jgi:hypothetical protein
MNAVLLLTLLAASPAADPPAKDEPPAKKELFAAEDWYKGEKGKEEEFVGTLSKEKAGGVGFDRFNPFRLTMTDAKGNKTVREVYGGGKDDLLNPYVGKKVKLVGKAVDMEVEGKSHREIWPARLELIADEKKDEKKEGKGDAPAKTEVLAGDPTYKMEPGQEKTFTGTIESKNKGAYTLVLKTAAGEEKKDLICYKTEQADLLEPYVGKTVKVTGKQVDGAVGFRNFSHVLPGTVELVAAKDAPKDEKKDPPAKDDKSEAPKEPKVIAQGVWRPAGLGGDPQQLVIRSAAEAVVTAGLGDKDKAKDEGLQKQATETLAKALKVETIDWSKQMVVVATGGRKNTGGYSVEITGLDAGDKVLTVKWRLNAPKPGSPVTQVISHPAAAALVDRFDGVVKFDPLAPKRDDSDK